MSGIEFVDSDPDGDTDEELTQPPRRRAPRWLRLAAVLVVAATVVGVVVARRSKDTPAAAPSSSASTSDAVPGGPDIGAPMTTEQVTALTSDGTSLYWVVGSRLYRGGPDGRPNASVAISPTGGDFAELQLVPDAAEKTIWLVSHGSSDSNGGAGNIEGFATDTLQRVVRASARSLIGGAAVLEGALYLVASGQLLRINAASGEVIPIASIDPHASDLVTTSRGLAYVIADGTRIGSWTPSGPRNGPALNRTDASLASVNGTLWLAGKVGSRNVLTSLSETGLGPVNVGPDDVASGTSGSVPTGLTDGLQIIATGRRALLVLGSDDGPLEFVCLDASTASVAARVRALSGLVTVLGGRVYEAFGGGVRAVSLTGCPA